MAEVVSGLQSDTKSIQGDTKQTKGWIQRESAVNVLDNWSSQLVPEYVS